MIPARNRVRNLGPVVNAADGRADLWVLFMDAVRAQGQAAGQQYDALVMDNENEGKLNVQLFELFIQVFMVKPINDQRNLFFHIFFYQKWVYKPILQSKKVLKNYLFGK